MSFEDLKEFYLGNLKDRYEKIYREKEIDLLFGEIVGSLPSIQVQLKNEYLAHKARLISKTDKDSLEEEVRAIHVELYSD